MTATATRHAPSSKLIPIDIYRAGLAEKIAVIKKGVPARTAKYLIEGFNLNQHVMLDALNLKKATINRKATKDQLLSTDESEHVVGLAELIGQVEAMVEEAGNPDGFDASEWLSNWLRQPVHALGGAKAIEYLDTMKGQALVAKILLQMQTGAYA